MSFNNPSALVIVASGASVSETVQTTGLGETIGIWAPSVTSCEMYLQVSYDTTSANFVRVTDPALAGSGAAWTWGVGVGSKAVVPPEKLLHPWPYARLELSAAQAAPRTFALVAKFF